MKPSGSLTRVLALLLGVGALMPVMACDAGRRASSPTSPSPPSRPVITSLSGVVIDITPTGPVPAPGTSVFVRVVPAAGGLIVDHGTSTGPDGRYHATQLPAGWAVVYAGSPTHRQVCAATAVLSAATEVNVAITSRANPQFSRTPLVVSGQIFESTPGGRVGIGNAAIEIDWAPDGPLVTVYPDANGYYSACGIPSDRPVAFWTLPPSYEIYDSPFTWHRFTSDATLDVELKRRQR